MDNNDLKYNYLGTGLKFPLKEEQRKVFVGVIYATIMCDISFLCEETAEEFCYRANLMKLFDEPIGIKSVEPYFGLVTSAAEFSRKKWARKHIIDTEEGKASDSEWVAKYLAVMAKMAEAKGIKDETKKPKKVVPKKNKIPRVIQIEKNKTKRVLKQTAEESKLIGNQPVKIIK